MQGRPLSAWSAWLVCNDWTSSVNSDPRTWFKLILTSPVVSNDQTSPANNHYELDSKVKEKGRAYLNKQRNKSSITKRTIKSRKKGQLWVVPFHDCKALTINIFVVTKTSSNHKPPAHDHITQETTTNHQETTTNDQKPPASNHKLPANNHKQPQTTGKLPQMTTNNQEANTNHHKPPADDHKLSQLTTNYHIWPQITSKGPQK